MVVQYMYMLERMSTTISSQRAHRLSTTSCCSASMRFHHGAVNTNIYSTPPLQRTVLLSNVLVAHPVASESAPTICQEQSQR
eukprot:2204-Heterococcus_DN1.PRE.3